MSWSCWVVSLSGATWIHDEEIRIDRYALSRLQSDHRVVLLGRSDVHLSTSLQDENTRPAAFLPVFSFLVRCGKYFLHHNFTCALLNALFGVQSRGLYDVCIFTTMNINMLFYLHFFRRVHVCRTIRTEIAQYHRLGHQRCNRKCPT